MERDSVTQAIIGAAIQVHTELGPGLLESTYDVCLAYELASRGPDVLRQVQLPVTYTVRLPDRPAGGTCGNRGGQGG